MSDTKLTTTTEFISFCDRKADNIKSDEFKTVILNNLQSKYQIDISFKPYNVLKHTRIPCVDRHPHILSLRTVGNSYFLYLTNIEGVNYCFYIDRKVDAVRHIFPRILSVKYRFSDHLFTDTLLDGELIHDMEGNWYFMLADVLVYKGQLLKEQTIERRTELIYHILQNDYVPDMVLDVCPFQVKKLFSYSQLDYILQNYVPNLPYNIKGICFNTINPQYSSYIYMFNQTERIPTKYRSVEAPQKKHKIPVKEEYQINTFKIIETNTSQIYDLYCLDNGKMVKYGVAYIGDASHQQFIDNLFKNAKSKINVLVDCYYISRYRKWKPVSPSKKKEADDIQNIRESVNNAQKSIV
jgi:hypothetical protein